MRFLLLGYGSIGSKHAHILREMGHEVVTVDPDPARGADYQSLPVSLTLPRLDGVLDCTPPDKRPCWSLPFQYRFVEKPLGIIPGGCVVPNNTWESFVQLGFCYHYLPSLAQFVNIIKQEPLAHLLIVGGQNLQAWHKQDYRTRKYWGVATDSLPHSLYIARWILSDYDLLGSFTGRFSDFKIETEDTTGVLLLSKDNVPCYCEVDYLREPRLFFIEVITNTGKRHYWEFDPAEAPLMYQRQMEAWVRLCAGDDIGDYPNLQDGIAVQWVLDEVLNET